MNTLIHTHMLLFYKTTKTVQCRRTCHEHNPSQPSCRFLSQRMVRMQDRGKRSRCGSVKHGKSVLAPGSQSHPKRISNAMSLNTTNS